jgi:Phage-related minor tail protein
MANVKFILDADEARAVNGFLKVVESQRKAERGFDRVSKKIDKKNNKLASFASGQVSSLGKMALGWVGVGSAIAGASALLAKHNELNDKAANRARSSEFSLGALSQLAGGDKKEMARMVSEAKKTSTGAGIGLDEAANLQFNLESFGIGDKREMFANLVGTVNDPSALAEAAVTMQTAFGKDEAGGIRAIINKGLAASSVSKTTLNQMLTSMSQAAPSLKQIGASDEESLGALAVLSKARKSSDVAATELDALSAVIMKKGLSGNGLLGGMGKIDKATAGMSDAEMLTYFGRKEGFKGYQTLKDNMPAVLSAGKTVQSGNITGDGDMVAGAIEARRSVDVVKAMEDTRISKQRKEQVNMDDKAVGELTALQMVNNETTNAIKRDEAGWQVAGRIMGLEMAKYMGGDSSTIKAAGDFAAGDLEGFTPSGDGSALDNTVTALASVAAALQEISKFFGLRDESGKSTFDGE